MSDAGAAIPARQYARIRYRLLLVDLLAAFAILTVFQWTGFSQSLARWWSDRVAYEPLVILGYMAVFGIVYYLLMLPLHFYAGYLLEHRFGLSRLTLRAWLLRETKHLAVSAPIGLLLVEGGYALLRHAPGSWPIWATVGWIGVSVILARVFPTVLLPIFYKTEPLADEALVNRLLELCRRTGISTLGVFRFHLGTETRKANAALAGLGKTRRVLVSDTLVFEFSPAEIEGVLAHEIGHHRYRHIVKLLVLSAVGSWVAFSLTNVVAPVWIEALGLQNLSNIGGFPMVMAWLSILGLVGLPLQNALSRYFERQCDRFAVSMADPQAFAGALRRLAALNLADPNPPRWIVWMFYDHPPITERINAAEQSASGSGFRVLGSGEPSSAQSLEP